MGRNFWRASASALKREQDQVGLRLQSSYELGGKERQQICMPHLHILKHSG